MKYEEYKNLNFDELVAMAEADSEQYAIEMEEMLEDVISTFSPEKQQGYRQLQWRINGTLARFKNPQVRKDVMVEIFWNGVRDFQKALNGEDPGRFQP